MNKYSVLKTLGRGSYGKVILCKNKSSGEKVAIKKVKLTAMSIQERRKVETEASTLSLVSHPNIVRYVESFIEKSSLYIAMEYVDGGDLEEMILDKRIAKSEEEILEIFSQILIAVNFMHSKKVLHRDLKPQNIFLMKTGVVKIGDFGVAKILDGTNQMAKTVVGTPFYISPEIWAGETYSVKADIWSLGCILYFMCMGFRPFDGKSQGELYRNVLKGFYKPIPDSISAETRKIVASMLKIDPGMRPTASQVLHAPIIRAAMERLVVKNTNQMKNKHSKDKSPREARNSSSSRKNANIRRSTHSILKKEDFEYDFETDVDNELAERDLEEDDFSEFGSFDDFHILEDATEKLQETLTSKSPTNTSDKVESLKEEIEQRLGNNLFQELYECVLDVFDIDCRRKVQDMERKDSRSVRMIRELIELENTLY